MFIRILALLFNFFCIYGAFADEDVIFSGDVSSENIETPLEDSKTAKGGPFRFEIASNAIGRARLSKHHLSRQSIGYSELEINGTLVFYYKPEPKEAAYLTIGYTLVDLEWRRDFFFNQQKFNNLNLALGAATKRMDSWTLRMQIVGNLDLDHRDLNHYLTWDFLCWGRYKFTDRLNMHLGLYGWMGMKVNRIIPILGFDWWINEKWKLNAVFPVNLSLVYRLNPCWTLALAARAFTSRNRVGSRETISKGIYEYRTAGGEINLRYKNENWVPIEANIHLGCDFGGTLKLSNKHHRHAKTFDIGAAPYVGSEVSARF